MCRLAAYIGPEIPLASLLTEPEHSLVEQSWAPRELRYAKVNADGYGVGWFRTDGTPACYVNPTPIWSDPNLNDLAAVLTAPVWLANIRSATHGLAVNHVNTQPFKADRLLFLHNGFIGDYSANLRFDLEKILDQDIRANILGTTDSEMLFAHYRQLKREDPELDDMQLLIKVRGIIENLLGPRQALLNMLIANPARITAIRCAINDPAPSLYYCREHPDFPRGALVASEPFDQRGAWQVVEPDMAISIDSTGNLLTTDFR